MAAHISDTKWGKSVFPHAVSIKGVGVVGDGRIRGYSRLEGLGVSGEKRERKKRKKIGGEA